jgi:transposase
LVDDGHARIVDGWLTADLRLSVKQRHTARRVYERLVAEHGFTGGYSSVQRWVKRWREEHRREAEGYAELEWAPGCAQVDFGQARAVVAGVERTVHFLVVSFPYSNMRYVVALPGESAECVCHGLTLIFARAGMVPRVLVFDNATGVGHRNKDGSVTQTRLFSLFCAHYGFETRFCNPYSGNEKGSVENAVGFVRRNLMVPVPSAEGWDALSAAWLESCDRIAERDHYRENVPIVSLFQIELERMLALPRVVFDACDWREAKADKTGAVTVDSNRYLAGPRWHSMRLNIGVRALGIELRSPDGEPIVMFERIWGHDPRTQIDPMSLLAIIARKPRAWGESPIRGDFPENVRNLLDRMDGRARAGLIDDIRRAATVSGFAAAARAASAIVDAGRHPDGPSIDQMARRGSQDRPAAAGQDLTRYDTYMEER